MAYTTDMRESAHRHYADGCKLLADRRFDNAGYHFGLSAECAIKQKLLHCGLLTSDDAFWKHWPTLKPYALLAVVGRTAAPARSLLQRGNFMQYWDVVMRYSKNGSIDEVQAVRWKADANEAMGLLI